MHGQSLCALKTVTFDKSSACLRAATVSFPIPHSRAVTVDRASLCTCSILPQKSFPQLRLAPRSNVRVVKVLFPAPGVATRQADLARFFRLWDHVKVAFGQAVMTGFHFNGMFWAGKVHCFHPHGRQALFERDERTGPIKQKRS